jgi:DNA-binding NtrC family response regulator
MQLKLLRVLEQREIEKLGGNRVVKVNMRIITATNRDLEQMVKRGEMREDFFYRINVVPIHIPPLRDRIEDIPLLVSELLRINPMARERNVNRVSNKALQQLMTYGWPGNVRELGNVVERAILKTNGPILRDVDLPNSTGVSSNGSGPRFKEFDLPLKEYLRRAERDYLMALLKRYRGGISNTAEHAMIDAATLHRKMKLHSLRREEFKEHAKA